MPSLGQVGLSSSRLHGVQLMSALLLGALALVLPQSESISVAHAFGVPVLANEKDTALVTFTGLRVYEDGSSTIIVSLTKSTPVTVSQDGKEVAFLLSGAKVKWRNNKNPLLAEHFNSNVLVTKLDDSKEGARLVVRLRQSVRPEHQMTPSGSGAYLRIDVPAPTKN